MSGAKTKSFAAFYRSAFALMGLVTTLSAPVSAPAQEPTPIRWGSTPALELTLPLYVAQSQGYLTQEGLKLDNPLLAPGVRLREALTVGDLDFAENTTTTLIVGRQAGLKQKAIFQYYTKELFSLFVPTKLRGEIKSVADLKGKKIAVTALGTGAHMDALLFIRKAGLNDSDVTFVGLNSADPATLVTALQSGQFDAQILWEPTSTLVRDRQIGFPLIDIRDPAVHEKWVGKESASEVLFVTEDMIAKRPDVVKRVVRALKKAMSYIQEHSASDVAAATAKFYKMDEAALAKILEPIKGNYTPDGKFSRSGIQVAIDITKEGGLLKQPLTFEDVVDAQFVGIRD